MTICFPFEFANLPEDAIEVARVADAWGVKGWFKVFTFNVQPDVILACRQWYLEPADRGAKAFERTLLMPIINAKMHSDTVVAHARGIDDRSMAEALRGARIFVPRSSFPLVKTDEYYWVDLIGLSVSNREGVVLGVVQDLLSTGPQTVLVITEDSNGSKVERMIPFVSAFIDDVCLNQKVITVDWQPDY